MEYVAKINGMTCSGCANTVESALSTIDGMETVEVNLDMKEVTLTTIKDVDRRDLEKSLKETSYQVSTLSKK
jgi:copper chaperone CopZ